MILHRLDHYILCWLEQIRTHITYRDITWIFSWISQRDGRITIELLKELQVKWFISEFGELWREFLTVQGFRYSAFVPNIYCLNVGCVARLQMLSREIVSLVEYTISIQTQMGKLEENFVHNSHCGTSSSSPSSKLRLWM